MIVVDSSALVAILEEEPEAEGFVHIIRDAPRRVVSAVTVYETGIVIGVRRGHESAIEVMALLEELGIEVVPFAEPHISGALCGLQPLWERYPSQGAAQPWRLHSLCSREEHECAVAVQGR